MSETPPPLTTGTTLPPPAPPLPPTRLGPLQRFIAPLGLSRASGRQDAQASHPDRRPPRNVSRRSYGSLPSQTASHRTGIPIAALDVNRQKTHAILAGKEILKTVRVHDTKVTEEFNLRSAINSYASTHGSAQGDSVARRREYLPARDVRWSVGKFDHIIATAAANGRIALYDVNAAGSRIELDWLHEHTGQVNRLDFDPFGGYLLLSASQDKAVRLWDIRDPRNTRCKQRFDVRSGVREVRWSPKEGNDFDFAVCADGGIIQNWDARNPLGPKVNINAHERGCHTLDWHPDGRHVVSGGFDKYIRVWDFKSDNRRQKPTYQFRAPQAVRIIRWRPPTGAPGAADDNIKQTTQIATTYHYDDPRIHLWDFRRPLLPFRELDTYNTPANDFLWTSPDLVWTVGDQGMFTQNDVTFAPQVQNSLPPCALEWTPDGEFAMFLEERNPVEASEFVNPVATFLNVPRDGLSGEDASSAPQFDVDEEDMMNDSSFANSMRRRQSRAMSSKSATSQANSPPTSENLAIQNLDKTILASRALLHNDQTGLVGSIDGATAEPEVVEFLAKYYAPTATEAERKASPNLILQRLERCFNNNADVCDEASLYRQAQSWRVLCAVLIPELKDWADGNRAFRRAEAARKNEKEVSSKTQHGGVKSSPFAKISSHDFHTKTDGKDTKTISNLFRGIKEVGKGSQTADHSSSSNMTTPLARPLPEPPRPANRIRSNASDDPTAAIGDLQALPPSLLNSHSTAAAASKALIDSTSIASKTPPSPPEQQRRSPSKSRHETDIPENSTTKSSDHDVSNPLIVTSKKNLAERQEQQRAVLREYRGQARPIFTLDTPVKNPQNDGVSRQDSAESFPMFPASTSGSHTARSLRESVDSQSHLTPSSNKDSTWLSRQNSGTSDSSVALEGIIAPGEPRRDSSEKTDQSHSGFYGSGDFTTGIDASSESNEQFPSTLERQTGSETKEDRSSLSNPHHSAVSASPELFQFDPSCSPLRPRIHSINPVSKTSLTTSKQGELSVAPSAGQIEGTSEVIASDEYTFSDFRPIDLSKYHPRLPFAWSSLPLICQMIAFDMDNGVAGAQFAAHVLLHVSPYFFSKDFRSTRVPLDSWPESVAERLMIPGLSHRIIETLLLKHAQFLRQMHHFEPMAEIRKACAELGYKRVIQPAGGPKEPGSSSTDAYMVAVACYHCQTPMDAAKDTCGNCRKTRPPCPVCLCVRPQFDGTTNKSDLTNLKPPPLWMFCQACGHSAHSSCMKEWLSHDFACGLCPTPGCECDCGPGPLRWARIDRQAKANEESKLIRGGAASTKKDPIRATPSPAVDKTRAALRAASGDRGTQSSDERRVSTRKSSGRPSVSGLASSRKSVRLVTPGEEGRSPAAG